MSVIITLIAISLFISQAFVQVLDSLDPTPLNKAKEAFEAGRDHEHQQRMRLIWAVDTNLEMPETLDVLFIDNGVYAQTLYLLQWRNGKPSASMVKLDQDPNTTTYFNVDTPPSEFVQLWQAICHVMDVKAEKINTQDDENRNSRFTFTSHESDYLLTWRDDPRAKWNSFPILHGKHDSHGIRDLDELKMVAITKLVFDRFPSTLWIPDAARDTESHWISCWRTILPGICNPSEVDRSSQIIIESACEMLGDLGDETDAALIQAVESRLRPKVDLIWDFGPSTYPIDFLKRKIVYTSSRIAFRRKWDSQAAQEQIHNTERRFFIDENQTHWLREKYQQRDPVGYHLLLLHDLNHSDPDLVKTSVKELFSRHQGQHRAEFHRLLSHIDPGVVLESAMVLLGIADERRNKTDLIAVCSKAEQDHLMHDALTSLDRLAADPSVPIPAGYYWFSNHTRNRAIRFLRDCPIPWRWDMIRYRLQFENPKEVDGRVIAELLGHLNLPRLSGLAQKSVSLTEPNRELLIATWRRCLVRPYNQGTVLALEELIALDDLDSLPLLRQVITELRAGCVQDRAEAPITAALPWLSRYDVDALDEKIKTFR